MNNDLVLYWNETAAELFNLHTNPGSDARRFAIVQIAINDAINTIRPPHDRYAYQGTVTPNASPEAAINSAAYNILYWAIGDIISYRDKLIFEELPPFPFDHAGAYQNILTRFDAKMNEIRDSHKKELGREIGMNAALAIIAWSERDTNYNNLKIRTNIPPDGTADNIFNGKYYTMPNATPPLNLTPDYNKLVVGFGDVKPFIISSPINFRRPLNYDRMNKDEVKDQGTLAYYNTLSPSEKDKIDYWSNLKQHIVWNNFSVSLIKSRVMNAEKTARLLAIIHVAMADGAICMFKDVYHFMHWRPVTALNHPPITPKWESYKATPRVPEFPSTFGILGGAVGEILEAEIPGNINIDLIHTYPNGTTTTLNYTSIMKAVEDNAVTKINCGWNFRETAIQSIAQGREIGAYVMAHMF